MYLVTGATGNIGTELIGTLAAAGHSVRALVRPASTAALPEGVERATGDLNDPASLTEALTGVRGVFLLPGYAGAATILADARAAGVEHVAQLSGRSAGGDDPTDAISTYMLAAEAAVKDSGLDWTILRPSGFMTNTYEWAPALRAGDPIRAPFPNVPVAMIDPADIAAVVAVVLTQPGHAGQTYLLSGPESLTPRDRADILAGVLDRPVRFEGLSLQESRRHLDAQMPQPYADAIYGFFGEGKLDESPVLPTVADVTGTPPHTFREWATAHSKQLTS